MAGDTTAPTITGSEKVSALTTKVNFSEPLLAKGTWKYTNAAGEEVAAEAVLSTDKKSIELTVADSVASGTVLTLTGTNVKDVAGNLVNPNPATVEFTVGQKDTVAPKLTNVTQTGAKEFEITFDKAVKNTAATATGAVTATGLTVNSVAPKTKGATSDTVYVVKTTAALTGVVTVGTTADFKNIDGTAATVGSKLVTFVKDTVAPKVTSTAVETVDGIEYLALTFDKNVDLSVNIVTGLVNATAKIAGSYDLNDLTTTLTTTAAPTLAYKSAADKKVVLVKLANLLTATDDKKGAQYTGTLTLTGVASETGVSVASATTEFTRGEDSKATTEKVEVEAIKQTLGNPNEVVVDFDKNVDVTTAKDIANYTIEGATVKSAKILSDAKDKVVLTLEAGSIKTSADYNVTVKNVKAENSTVVMDTVTKAVSFKENVAPKIAKVEFVAADVVKVEFTEAVGVVSSISGTTVTGGTVTAANFEVKYDDKVVELVSGSGAKPVTTDGDSAEVEATKAYKTVYLKLATAVTDTNKSLTVAAKDLVDATTDAAAFSDSTLVGNKVSTDAVSK